MSESSDDAHGTEETERDAEDAPSESADESVQTLRREVEEKYDFENFGPGDMAEMSAEEWDAAFDPDTWITGEELLDRVEADLKNRVATREVFARVERFEDLLIAYSDSGYAAVYPDGSIEGSGTVLRDVKPTVALCSMDSYDVPEMPEGDVLPEPQDVPENSDALGNTVLQVIAAAQVLAGLVLLGASALFFTGVFSQPQASGRGLNFVLLIVAGLGFLVIGIFLFATVANARLSDKFRAEEFRNRLRAIGLEDGERPDFLDEIEGIEGELPEGLGADRAVTGPDDTDRVDSDASDAEGADIEGTNAEDAHTERG